MLDDLTIAIRSRTAHIVAHRFQLENERHRNMSRLSEKLKQAGGVANRQSVKIEARADAIIAREAEIEKKTDQAFSPHEAILSEAETALDAVERELALLSNDPLESSGDSQEGAAGAVVKPYLGDAAKEYAEAVQKQPRARQNIYESIMDDQPATADRVALGPHPDQPEGPIMATIDTATAQEVEQGGIATFRAAE